MPSKNCGDSENRNWTESDRRPTDSISRSDDHCVGPGWSEQRILIQQFSAPGLPLLDSNGASWYNSLQTSLTKRMSKGLQMLVSYFKRTGGRRTRHGPR